MTSLVKLYVYDLSNGMARALSQQLTGRQIEGIWHTSVVVFGQEIFYGQGINITRPGQSPYGKPLQMVDMGKTEIDQETFDDYIVEMREHYTADKYHLLDFNCNSFSNDVVGFLTGGSIPDYIKDLPSDFLSTPLGAALRPTIDAMFRPPIAGRAASAQPETPDSQLAASLLQSVPDESQGQPPSEYSSITSSMHVTTNPSSLDSILKSHRAIVVFFTSQSCPPCRMIEPVFERFAEERGAHDGRQGAAFVKFDIGVDEGRSIATQCNIRATPTFHFFLDGIKKGELKGANAGELKSQIDLLIYEAYPPHPHTQICLPVIEKLSLNPILFTQIPAVDTIVTKFFSFIDEATWPASVTPTRDEIKNTISHSFAPYLKARFSNSKASTLPSSSSLISSTPAMLASWTLVTTALTGAMPADVLFPLVDMWRLAFLDPATGTWASSPSIIPCGGPISVMASRALEVLVSDSASKGTRNYVLTVLRLVCNTFSNVELTRKIFTNVSGVRLTLTTVLVQSLLHEDASVRTAASSLTFNVAAWLQNGRIEAVRTGKGIQGDVMLGEDEEWEVELVSAIVEALSRETANEEVVHRLTAALALFIRLSPWYDGQLKPLLEVLEVQGTLKGKLCKGDGWEGEGGVCKKEVQELIKEVAGQLCV